MSHHIVITNPIGFVVKTIPYQPAIQPCMTALDTICYRDLANKLQSYRLPDNCAWTTFNTLDGPLPRYMN